MNNRRVRARDAVPAIAAMLGLIIAPLALAAPGPAAQIEGTIAAIEPGILTVTRNAGDTARIAVTGETVVIQRMLVQLADIRPNDFVGVTARREPDGSLTAISINIFPPEFRGRVREAQFVMETGNVMTNATVFQNVGRIEGRTLYLKLGDGAVVIAVPKEAQVIRLTVIPQSRLQPGMRVTVRGTPGADGSVAAATITVDAP